jgi:hypothetical protein
MKVSVQKIVFILLLSIYSCTTSPAQLERINREYRNTLAKYPKEYTNHFPDSVCDISYNVLFSENISISHPKIWLKLRFEEAVIDSLSRIFSVMSIGTYSPDDTCLLVIDRHLTEDNWLQYDKSVRNEKKLVLKEKACYEHKLPLPKFWRESWIETKKNDVGLNNEYILYVLDAKSGVFLNKDVLPNGKYSPLNWIHGYSKGVAINRNSRTVIYWFDIW